MVVVEVDVVVVVASGGGVDGVLIVVVSGGIITRHFCFVWFGVLVCGLVW